MEMTISNLHYTNLDVAQTQSPALLTVKGDTLEVRQRHKSSYRVGMKLIVVVYPSNLISHVLEAYFR